MTKHDADPFRPQPIDELDELDELSDADEQAIERIVDTRGVSYEQARRIRFGERAVAASSDVETYKLPGKPLSFPPSGHVRDFSSIPDAERVFSVPRADTPHAREIVATTFDKLVLRRVQNEYVANELSFGEARARLWKHFEDRIERTEFDDMFDRYFGDGNYRSSLPPVEM